MAIGTNVNTTSFLRQINALRCLRLLKGGDLLSRADIARQLGVSRATVGNAIKALLDSGLVLESDEIAAGTRLGRPGVGVTLNGEGAYFVGVDVGTRVITGVLLDFRMHVVSRVAEPTGKHFKNPETVAQRLMVLIERMLSLNPSLLDKIEGGCVSVPGLVGRYGSVVNAPILEWRDYPLQSYLEANASWDWPLIVCNDAFAFANAEITTTGAAGTDHTLLVLLHEGIGGAVVDNGRVVTGANGYSGEIGHMLVSAAGRLDSFQSLGGAKAFAEVFTPDLAIGDGVAMLLERSDDREVGNLIDAWAAALAAGLTNAIHLIDPNRIVLGGPLAALFPERSKEVRAHIRSALLAGFNVPDIRVAQFGADGAAIGAAATIRDSLFALPDLESGL